ncbi:hypothetical protein ACIGJO_27315 [Streptomyces sp. NPDC079020]|uniref:hypothetical protein n=1 Tax=Streptomyces sp. NPDC079020 TaxID=3365722 RepID=UPI0037D9225F
MNEANRAHATDFQLDHRFADGFPSGAWLLTDGSGQQAVLKWSPDRGWASQIERAARSVAKVHSAGYPTPAWLAAGMTSNGFGYQIQELAPGRSGTE